MQEEASVGPNVNFRTPRFEVKKYDVYVLKDINFRPLENDLIK